MKFSNIGRVAAVAAMVATGSAVAATPAFAANAPGCVSFYQSGGVAWHTAHVTNGCSNSLRLRIILSLHVDGPCSTFAPGQSRSWGYPGQSNLQGVQTC